MIPSRALVTIAAVASLVGCSSKQAPPPADPIVIERYEAKLAPAYLLQPGDLIAVKFYLTPQLNEDNLVVRPDGAISLPYVGNVVVAGRTAGEVEAELRERYRPELATPSNGESVVTLIVRRLNSTHVHVGGEVAKDGRIKLEGPLTAMEAIQRAGGILETGDAEKVVIIRQDASGKRVGYRLDLSKVMDGSEPGKDVMLQPSDIVFVPTSTIADLNQVVRQYIRNMLPVEPSLGYAIAP